MTDKKHEDKTKIKKPVEASVELEFTSDSAIETGKITSDTSSIRVTKYNTINLIDEDENGNLKTTNIDIVLDTAEIIQKVTPHVNLSSMREDYQKNGKSTKEILSNFEQDIINHRNDPIYIIKAFSTLSSGLSGNYDHNKGRAYQGSTAEEMLEKILSLQEGEELDGFVCMNINELVAKIVHDCGMNAVILCGKASENENHATLLYQVEDGKFVYTDYGKSMIVEAPNIKEAARAVYKKSADLETFGYISFVDDNNSYQEFALKDEAVWGRELDKRDYISENPLNFKLDSNTGVKAKYNISTAGNMSGEIKGTLGYSNSVKERETSIALGYQKTQNTTCFDRATSVGVKLEHKGINKRHNGETFWGLKFVADDTKGELPSRTFELLTKEECNVFNENLFEEMEKIGYDRDATIQLDAQLKCYGSSLLLDEFNYTDKGYTSEHITSFIKGEYGRKTTLVKEKNTKLENAYKGTLLGSVDVGTTGKASFGGDARVLLEDGFSLTNKIGKSVLKNNVSFGAIADLKLTGGAQKGGIQFGTKLNGESSFVTQVSPNTSVGVSGQAYATVTKPATEVGAGVNIFGTHKPNNSKVTFYGNVNAGLERQNLRIGGFNNLTENVRTLGVSAGAQLSEKVSVGAGYTGYFDKINSTRNRSTFTVTGAVNL